MGGDWPEPLAPSAAGRWWRLASRPLTHLFTCQRAASGRARRPGTEAFGPDLVRVDASPSSDLGSTESSSVWGTPPFQRLVGFGSVTRRRSKGEGWAWLRGASLRAPPTGRLSAWAPGAPTGGSCPAGQCWPCPPLPEELGGAGDGRGQPPPLPPSARVLYLSFPGGRGCCH